MVEKHFSPNFGLSVQVSEKTHLADDGGAKQG